MLAVCIVISFTIWLILHEQKIVQLGDKYGKLQDEIEYIESLPINDPRLAEVSKLQDEIIELEDKYIETELQFDEFHIRGKIIRRYGNTLEIRGTARPFPTTGKPIKGTLFQEGNILVRNAKQEFIHGSRYFGIWEHYFVGETYTTNSTGGKTTFYVFTPEKPYQLKRIRKLIDEKWHQVENQKNIVYQEYRLDQKLEKLNRELENVEFQLHRTLPTRLFRELKKNDYVYRLYYYIDYYRNLNQVPYLKPMFFEIFYKGKLIYSESAEPFGFMEPCGLCEEIRDINNDGIPELVLTQTLAGNPGGTVLEIFVLGKQLEKLSLPYDGIAAGFATIWLEDRDGDNIDEIIIDDIPEPFTFFGTCRADSIAKVEQVFRYKNHTYCLAPELMKKPPPTVEEFQQHLDAIKKEMIQPSCDYSIGGDIPGVPTPFWSYVVELIYSGNLQAAYAFYDLAYPFMGERKKYSWLFFKTQLAEDPYWPTLWEYLIRNNYGILQARIDSGVILD